ncbi:MAG: hypothetical protein HY067_16940 [Betaproteobacteria bacterium]|nr:hypothetical protein [Betaproteobacteria bacterium]
MKSRKRLFIGVGAAVAALLVLPFLIPLGYFIPEIERFASEQLKAPVKVESLSLFFLPLPHLTVKGIAVGKKPFLEVEKVIITPRLTSLFSSQNVISEISLHGVVIGQPLIAKASAWAGRSGAEGPATIRVERVEVRDAFVNLTDFKLRQIDVDLELTPESGLARARIRADHDHLNATLVPQGRDFAVEIAAREWKLPAGPPLLMSSLNASGTLSPQQGLTISTIEGRLYDGTVSGKLNVGWSREWTIAGNLDIQSVEIQSIVALLTKDTTISGRLTANPVVDMRAPSAAQLGDALDVESDFKVEKGILYNIDLSNAPKALLNKDALNGGETRFDNFSGHLSVDSAGYDLSKVEIASGVLTADAELSVSSKQELSGQIDVAIKGTSALVSTPLALSGTVQHPSLYPSKAALAGAAAGTALLGPGLGTTVGMKAVRMTQKLFGGKPNNNKKKAEPAKAEATKQAKDQAAADEKKQPSAVHTGR